MKNELIGWLMFMLGFGVLGWYWSRAKPVNFKYFILLMLIIILIQLGNFVYYNEPVYDKYKLHIKIISDSCYVTHAESVEGGMCIDGKFYKPN